MFEPRFALRPATASALMRIEAARVRVAALPITATVLAGLRETARLRSTHFSTRIEGNRLTLDEAAQVLAGAHFPGRERDEREVRGLHRAMGEVERLALRDEIGEVGIRGLHALLMSAGNKRPRPTPYRDGQNVIRDGSTGAIVYLPPVARDVPLLMGDLVRWIDTARRDLPVPVVAGVAHYQLATIHPYYDGNGRLARLLATWILHAGGYDLRGIYSLEEYYARDLASYYGALSIGPSHNYYEGRAEADITSFVDYFCLGIASAFESVERQAALAASRGEVDRSAILRRLDVRQRKAIALFRRHEHVTSAAIGALFGLSDRGARALCARWVEGGFLTVGSAARKTRTYALAAEWRVAAG